MISMFIREIPALKTPDTPLTHGYLYSSGITEVEMRAVKESAERVNAKEGSIHEPMAAAIDRRHHATRKEHGGDIEVELPKLLFLCLVGLSVINRRKLQRYIYQ